MRAALRRLLRRLDGWDDPIGWDEKAGRCHDVTVRSNGRLLHHSMCWCRAGSVPTGRTEQ